MKQVEKAAGVLAVIILAALVFAGCDNGTTEKWKNIDNPSQLYGTWKGFYSIKNINEVYDFEEAFGEEGISLGDIFDNITMSGSFDIALKIEPDPGNGANFLLITVSGSTKITVTGDIHDTGFQVMIIVFAILAENNPDEMEIEFWADNNLIDPGNVDYGNAAGINKIAITIPITSEPESVSFAEFIAGGVKINESGTWLWLPANNEYGIQNGMILTLQSGP